MLAKRRVKEGSSTYFDATQVVRADSDDDTGARVPLRFSRPNPLLYDQTAVSLVSLLSPD